MVISRVVIIVVQLLILIDSDPSHAGPPPSRRPGLGWPQGEVRGRSSRKLVAGCLVDPFFFGSWLFIFILLVPFSVIWTPLVPYLQASYYVVDATNPKLAD
jgi:hypothetical protein